MNVFHNQRSANRISLVSVAIVALALISCTDSQVLTTLEAVVSAAEVALPVIGAATNLDPAITVTIGEYLRDTSVAARQASAILAGSGTSAQKAAQIAAVFANVASLNLPAGTPAEIGVVVNGVIQAVQNFLGQFQSSAPPVVLVSAKAKAKLANIALRSQLLELKLKEVKR